MGSDKRRYKNWELYACLALNRLAEELEINIYQKNIEEVLDEIFEDEVPSLPKYEISHEIKSNHHMTNKVLDRLEEDGLIEIDKGERKYNISITKEGVFYIKKFNSYFIHMYEELIRDHYRYRRLPEWFVSET